MALLLAWFAQSRVLSEAPGALGVLLRIPSGVFALWLGYIAARAAYRLIRFDMGSTVAGREHGRDDFRLALLHLAQLPLFVVLFWWLGSASHWWGLKG